MDSIESQQLQTKIEAIVVERDNFSDALQEVANSKPRESETRKPLVEAVMDRIESVD